MIILKKLSLKLLKNILRRVKMTNKKVTPKKIKTVTKVKQPDAMVEAYNELEETLSKVDTVFDKIRARVERLAKWK